VQEANIYALLTDVFREVFDDDELVLRPEMTADDVEGWDSMVNIRLMLAVERAFKVSFSASQIASLKNVGDLAELIRSRQ
jgi:acyl carrier protein